jgi:hypothetical protein
MAVALFATGIALSSLLIAAYSRPFTGEISVKPEKWQLCSSTNRSLGCDAYFHLPEESQLPCVNVRFGS